jgi:hypothetical protein
MDVLQDVRHGVYRQCSTHPGTDDKRASFVCAADYNQGSTAYGLLHCEIFDDFMNYFSIFEPDNKYAALPCLGVFHR